jgi:hypothetical protein
MEEYTIRLTEDGEVSSTPVPSDRERESKLDKIIEMINDPETPPGPIKRAIASELATVNRLMIKYGNDVSILEGLKIKALSEQVKALRELGKEVEEADIMSKKDFLNWEGKKFRYAIDEYREGAKEAMREAKLDESTINSILNHWRDIMAGREQDIRRAIDKLDSSRK